MLWEGKHKLVSLLSFSCPVVSDSLWPHRLQHTRPLYPSPSPEVCPSSYPSHQWCHLAILSSDSLFSFCPQSFPASGTFPMSQLFVSDDHRCSHQVAKVLELQLQHQSFQWIFSVDIPLDGLVWSPCHSRNSQESSPASQFKGINSLALSLLDGPSLTPGPDYWKNYSLDYMDHCQQNDVSAF